MLIVFDVMHLDGRSTRELPYRLRRELLRTLDLDGGALSLCDEWIGEGPALADVTRAHGLEGVVAKRLDGRYAPGRRHWSKVSRPKVARQGACERARFSSESRHEFGAGADD